MLVYRLQHRIAGKGPYMYSSGNCAFDLHEICGGMNSRNCPEPDDDALLKKNFMKRFSMSYSIRGNIRGSFLFAFVNPEQLKKWFGSSGIMKMLAHHGFEVAVKDIPDDKVIIGDSQCIVNSEAWFETPVTTLWIPERYVGRWSYEEAIIA